jgi:predicted deacylase
VVAVPCVNVWGFLKFQREFADGRDLNRQFPGKEDGFSSQVFCTQKKKQQLVFYKVFTHHINRSSFDE